MRKFAFLMSALLMISVMSEAFSGPIMIAAVVASQNAHRRRVEEENRRRIQAEKLRAEVKRRAQYERELAIKREQERWNVLTAEEKLAEIKAVKKEREEAKRREEFTGYLSETEKNISNRLEGFLKTIHSIKNTVSNLLRENFKNQDLLQKASEKMDWEKELKLALEQYQSDINAIGVESERVLGDPQVRDISISKGNPNSLKKLIRKEILEAVTKYADKIGPLKLKEITTEINTIIADALTIKDMELHKKIKVCEGHLRLSEYHKVNRLFRSPIYKILSHLKN